MPHPSQPRASGGGTAAAALGLLPRGTTVVVQPGTQYAPREDFSFDDICALAQRIEKGEVLMAWLKQQDDQGRPKYGIARSTPRASCRLPRMRAAAVRARRARRARRAWRAWRARRGRMRGRRMRERRRRRRRRRRGSK